VAFLSQGAIRWLWEYILLVSKEKDVVEAYEGARV
jgi:hypothetical protein